MPISHADNVLSDQHGGYDHVTLFMPIHQPTARTLAKLDQIQPSTEIGDCTRHPMHFAPDILVDRS